MEDLIIQAHEIKQELVNTINNSGLPAFVLEPIIKDIYEQILKEDNRQYQEAIQTKEQKKEEQKKEEKKKGDK